MFLSVNQLLEVAVVKIIHVKTKLMTVNMYLHHCTHSYQSRRMASSCTACSWTPVAGTMTTWWLKMRYLEWWMPCCQWCILSHSGTTCPSHTSTMLLCTRPQPEPGLCPPLVHTGSLLVYTFWFLHVMAFTVADTFYNEWAGSQVHVDSCSLVVLGSFWCPV